MAPRRRAGYADVEEALFMSNRVIVLRDRPVTIKAGIAIALPFPRHRDDPRLVEPRREVSGLPGLDVDW